MTDTALPAGYSVRYTPCPDGIQARVWFPYGQGGGSTIAPDQATAERRALEIIRDHEEHT